MGSQLTNFPNGISSFGVPILSGSGGLVFTGNYYFVNETYGLDGNAGTSPSTALKTLDKALALESAATGGLGGLNSVIYFSGTQHRTSTLVWNLPQTHLIGIDAPIKQGKRARISVTGSTGFNNLVSVTAAGCYFANFGTFFGWPNSSAALTPWTDTGGRNCYDNVEFLGFGDATVTTGTANLTGARSFVFNNNTGESTFRNCVFGADTLQRGAANYSLEIAGNAPRMTFENCLFVADLAAGGTASSHVLIGVAGIDRACRFSQCQFLSDTFSGGSAMAQALNISGSAGGIVLLDQCTAFGITAWQTTPTTNTVMNMVKTTSGGGLALEVF